MKRQIIFRGKRLDNGEWVYGDLEYNRAKNIARIHTYGEEGEYLMQHLVEPDSVGQYTDVDDVNGNPIFEGDIVETFAIYLEYQQVGNYPPPNIEVEEWAVKRSVDAVKFSYGSFDINGFPIMFEDMMCDDDEADKPTEREEFEDMWEDNSYDIRDKYPYLTWDYFRKPHIIGNIFDTPDLLNGK